MNKEEIIRLNECTPEHAEHIIQGVIDRGCERCTKFWLAHDARGRT